MGRDASLYTDDYKQQPLWWEAAPPARVEHQPLPAQADVVIVGSGYTGLTAALPLARAGRLVLVLEAGRVGEGCSTRNGGQISTSIKPDYEELAHKAGHEAAFAIRKEGQTALAWLGELIGREGIDCDWTIAGRFHAAHNPKQYEALARDLAHQPKGLEVPYEMVPRAEQRREIGSDAYYGGAVFPAHASLHPAKYHAGLLARVQQAGATVRDGTPVTGIEREGRGFKVVTDQGSLQAAEVLVATNGYTGRATPWLRRRVIPIGSYMIATEPLPPGLAATLIPQRRVITDTRKLVFYYRLCPEGRRVVFGGRVAANETDVNVSAPRLHREVVRIFPELAQTRISHSWMGTVAYTFDHLPHLGRHEGIWYAAGYCGSGVSLSTYFGTRIAQQMLGQPEGRTALDGVRFQTRPLYSGRPWFLPAMVRWYRVRDRLPL